MSAAGAIARHAPYHEQLVTAIAELDCVPAAMIQQNNYIKDLESRVKGQVKKIKLLEEKTKKELNEYEEIRDSTTQRLAAKLTRRKEGFKAKVSKEERCGALCFRVLRTSPDLSAPREYLEALDEEMQAKTQQETLEGLPCYQACIIAGATHDQGFAHSHPILHSKGLSAPSRYAWSTPCNFSIGLIGNGERVFLDAQAILASADSNASHSTPHPGAFSPSDLRR
jgi:hypothetical protein